MPTFSRWMPRSKSPSAIWRWGGFLTLLAVALWFFIHYSPWVPAGTAIAIVLLYVMNRARAARLRKLAAERQGESICTFARAYARGDRDPFVLRAVYEELAPYLAVGGTAIPLRTTDLLEQDLQVDGEELEFLAVHLKILLQQVRCPQRNRGATYSEVGSEFLIDGPQNEWIAIAPRVGPRERTDALSLTLRGKLTKPSCPSPVHDV